MAGFPKKRAEKATRPKPGVPFKKDMITKMIIKHTGNLSRIADAIGSSRGALRNFVDKHPEIKQLLQDQRERVIDELEESCFSRAVRTKDTTLQIFLLKTQGKARGYEQNESQETAKDIASAAFEYILSKDPKPINPTKPTNPKKQA